MFNPRFVLHILLLTVVLFLCGCSTDDPASPSKNRPPAFADGMYVSEEYPSCGEVVRVHAYASDPDGDELSYSWMVSGGEVLPMDRDSSVEWVLPLESGSATIAVNVSDGAEELTQTRTVYTQSVESWTVALEDLDNAMVSSILDVGNGYTLLIRSLDNSAQAELWNLGRDGDMYGQESFEEGRLILPLQILASYWIAGSIKTNEFDDEFYLAYTTPHREIVWERSWGGDGRQEVRKFVLDDEGSAYVLGNSESPGGSYLHPVAAKFDRWGDQIWQTELTAGSLEGWVSDGGLVVLPDGRCIVGYNRMYGRSQAVFAVLDSNGVIQSRMLGESQASGLNVENVFELDGIYYGIAYDEQFLGAGMLWIYNLDPDAGIQASYLTDLDRGIVLSDVILTKDRNLTAVGYQTDENDENNTKAILMKVSLDGDVKWIHRFGGQDSAVFHDVVQANDGSIVCAGELTSSENRQTYPWVVKTNQHGLADE